MIKGITLAGIALVVVGFGGLGIVGVAGHSAPVSDLFKNGMSISWNKTISGNASAATNYDKSGSALGVGVTEVDIQVNVAAINVTPSDSNDVTAHAYGTLGGIPASDMTFSVNKTGHRLQVVLKRPTAYVTLFSNQRMKLDVSIPKHLLQTLQIESNVGKIDVSDVPATTTIVSSNTGAITVSNTPGSVRITSDTGAIQVSRVSGDVNVQSSTGAVDVREATGSIDIRNNVGAVTVQVPSITHDIHVTDDVGSIRLSSAAAASNLHFHLHTDTGHVQANVPNASYTAHKNTDVQGSVGSGAVQVDLDANTGGITFESP